jgi:hypothetical protein
MSRWYSFFVALLGLFCTPLHVQGGSAAQITPDPVNYTFGGQVVLQAQITSDISIEEVQVFLQSAGDTDVYSGTALLQGNLILYQHDLTSQPLRAFAMIEYWFRVIPEKGEPFLSDRFSFIYEDNRFAWQTLSNGPITIHWYEGDISFAQSILNAAAAGLDSAGKYLTLPQVQPVNFYVYASGLEMQSTLRLGGLRWIAGHADPDLGVSVVSLPPGPDQQSEIQRQIPHELMHLLLYQAVGPAYYTLPVWFKEGLASANESRPNPDYYVILSSAVEQDRLIPMAALCQSFPQDSTVYLAYAQSDSFIRYLYQRYGQSGLQNLLTSYAQGGGCEEASTTVLGLSLKELDQDWRRNALNENGVESALQTLLPWIVLLLIVLIVPLFLFLANLRRATQQIPLPQTRQTHNR